MKVAIVHSHFRRGGVTRVVENAVASLANEGVDCLALSGEAYTGNDLPNHQIIEGLGYDNEFKPGAGAALAQCLVDTAAEAFGGLPDIWHIHNHSLGKNLNFPEALDTLALSGARLLLQIHDFAEDGRPANYYRLTQAYPEFDTFSKSLYPAAPQIHYAALNRRDAAILGESGLNSEQLHVLPNSVSVPQFEVANTDILPEIEKLILYPTRAIRRKNVGEMLLHSTLTSSGTVFGTTLIPENPEWLQIHQQWETLAKELKLPVHFGLGNTHAFPDLIKRADALITTSVAEGFGLAFLEPALFGKPLIGRNLPEITKDFQAWGIELNKLYTELSIPTDAIERDLFEKKIQTALEANSNAYHRQLPANATSLALAAAQTEEGWDFGRLDEDLQAQAIRYALKNPDNFADAAKAIIQAPTNEEIIADREAIETHLSLDRYGKQLGNLYSQILECPTATPEALDAEAILNAFLSPERLYLLRT